VTATELRDSVIGFLYVGNASPIPEIMVASVRAAMPAARIVQMTDLDTGKVTGVDDVIRKPWDRKFLMPYRLLHLKDFPAANVIFLDADVVVQKDLRPLFLDEFDVGLTYRDETDPSLRKSPQAYQMMPFNTGVMLSRPSGRQFWLEAHQACIAMTEDRQSWFGDQLAIKEVAARTALKVKQYPCALYNYSPARWNEDLSEKFVIHYKGENRKIWMLEQWKHLLLQGR
jgi:lipopolysaccharide biosynthesis glycosyltransferase